MLMADLMTKRPCNRVEAAAAGSFSSTTGTTPDTPAGDRANSSHSGPRKGLRQTGCMAPESRRVASALGIAVLVAASLLCNPTAAQEGVPNAEDSLREIVEMRLELVELTAARVPARTARPSIGAMSAPRRRQAVDEYWGPGPSTAEKLERFDKFWQYADEHYATFHGIKVDWAALRRRYRSEVAAGVSRGRFAAIMNHLALALRESHTQPLDLPVNLFTVPEPGTPLLAVGAWTVDTVGACLTAQDDGSALVYSVEPGHPLGLKVGDRILGYDGKPWRTLYRDLLREELPLWPIWWGSSPKSFDHSFVMAAGTNWHLFAVMDIRKQDAGQIVHMRTSLMPGVMWYGFCSEQLQVPGVPKPSYFSDDFVSWGIVDGTHIGYIYVWGWEGTSEEEFEQAVNELTQIQRVDGLIIDLRFNSGGFLNASRRGLGILFERPTRSIGFDERKKPDNHFKMKKLFPPKEFVLDRDQDSGEHIKPFYDGPIAVLTGPGSVSAGDFSALFLSLHPKARTFGKGTASAFNFPTQPLLGRDLDLGPDWFARIAEANGFAVSDRNDYLTHDEVRVDESVWLLPEDVAAGKDTVVAAALRWLDRKRAVALAP
jgi:C-terminal processing protease CtpA/Prc